MSRLVVVTGASRGIGRAVAARFAALGDDVVALGRDEEALGRLGDGVRPVVCDVTDEDAVAGAFALTGEVDVLVNNAGVAESAPLARTTLASWERQMAVNATGAFLCTRAAIVPMRERGSGAIITVASTAGRVGAPYTAAYTASKHAAVGLMRAAAAELAGTGVTANAVCPAFVDTDLTRAAAARIAERTGRSARESEAALAGASPLGRLLDPDEVAAAVEWLASPAAAAISGQTLILDGGGIQT
ncbi:MAG TPA: SDR family NAD(P)-dependent oxidoreductase [Solirubrobacteraceae bacterium]|nr:SDR family NAD(P)-dependent oxidoreductase [Solirubrobacteraceae bacterium]